MPPRTREETSRPPDLGRAANLLCCLRALFGVTSRAEIIAWLLDAMPALSRARLSESLAAARKLTGSRLISAVLDDVEKLGQVLKVP